MRNGMRQLECAETVEENQKFRKELMSIALPIALQNLMVALVGASDALMLGRFSQDAVSAVSLANQISFVMNLFIGSVVGGCSVLITQYYGKRDYTTIKKLMSVGVSLCLAVSFLFFIATRFWSAEIMALYTPERELIRIGSEYLQIVGWAYLFSGVSQMFLMLMKISGRASMSAAVSIMTVVIDMLVDLFLIYGLAGLPRRGVAGCAISTVAVEASAFAVCLVDSYQKDHIHLERESLFGLPGVIYRDLAAISLPILASCLTWGIGYSLRSMIMGHLGSDAIAAESITSVVLELTTCFCKGLASGATIMVGRLLGQGLLKEAKACASKFWRVSFLCGFGNIALLLVVGPIAAIFFVLTDAARSYLMQMMVVAAFYLFAFSLNNIITCGVLPAGGDTIYDAESVIVSKWCFSLPLALLGTFVFHWPVMLIYIILMSDEIVKTPWIYPRYKKYLWLKNITRENV